MYELKVEDMTCGHCMSRVTKAVKSVDPLARVQIELQSKHVSIESTHALEELTDAMAEAGYPAKPYVMAN